MRLGTGVGSVATIKVSARYEVLCDLVDIDKIKEAENGERDEAAKEKPGIFLAPLIASEGSCLSILQLSDDWRQSDPSAESSTGMGDAGLDTYIFQPVPFLSHVSQARPMRRPWRGSG